jgi:hypothetical protein
MKLLMRDFLRALPLVIAMTMGPAWPVASMEKQQAMNAWPGDRKSPDGSYVAAIANHKLELRSARDGRVLWTYPQDNFHTIWGVSWSPDGKRLAVSDAGVVRVLDAATGREQYIFGGIKGDVFAPDWSKDGKYLVAIGTKAGSNSEHVPCSVIAWDALSQKELIEIAGHPGSTVLWAPDSKRFAFNSDDQNVQIWDALSRKRLATIQIDGGGRPPFNWSPDGRYVVVADWNVGEGVVYDSQTGRPVAHHPFKGDIQELNWSKDGKTIVCTPMYGPSQVWQLNYQSNGRLKAQVIKDRVLGSAGYVPKKLNECFAQLNAELDPKVIKKIKEGSENDLSQYHFGLGMWIRNKWGLWGRTPLAQSLAAMGAQHPDDMSGIIIHAYWRHLNGLPLEVDKQLAKYNAFWAEQIAAATKEKDRSANAASKIQGMMLGVKLTSKPEAALEIPSLAGEQLRVRYAAPYKNAVLITTKQYLPPDSFRTPAFMVDLEHSAINPLKVPELDSIENLILLGDKLYLHGIHGSSQRLIEIAGSNRKDLPLPLGDGWIRLGFAKDQLLAVRAHAIFAWRDDKWQKIFASENELPRTALPPQLIGGRVYFRDEGRHEDDKRLSWIDLNPQSRGKLTYFDENVGVVGREGPRWENVNSFAESVNGAWICAGEFINSLMEWSKTDGYRIVTMNNELNFDGKSLLGHDTWCGIPENDVAITCVFPQQDKSLLAFGPTGVYSLKGLEMTQILKFTKGIQDTPTTAHMRWVPTHVVKVGPDDYFIGTHWGGTMRLRRDAQHHFSLQILDAKVGKPVEL